MQITLMSLAAVNVFQFLCDIMMFLDKDCKAQLLFYIAAFLCSINYSSIQISGVTQVLDLHVKQVGCWIQLEEVCPNHSSSKERATPTSLKELYTFAYKQPAEVQLDARLHDATERCHAERNRCGCVLPIRRPQCMNSNKL